MKLRQIRVDGYKNLVNCVVDIGDFNVLVGPNNSGKSNLMEVFHFLDLLCFGSDKHRSMMLHGVLGRKAVAQTILDSHGGKPARIGVNWDVEAVGKAWNVDYEMEMEFMGLEHGKGGICGEILTATPLDRRGPRTQYIMRREKSLKVAEQSYKKTSHGITRDNSSLPAIKALYPDYAKLPPEFPVFIESLMRTASLACLALSPSGIRSQTGTEGAIAGSRISEFDPLVLIDDLRSNKDGYELFQEIVADILGFGYIHLETKDFRLPAEAKRKGEVFKRERNLFLGRTKQDVSWLEMCSDGTLIVVALIAAYLSDADNRPILLVEELENCLHPAAIKKLIRFFQDNSDRWPVLITTHSPYVLNCVDPEDVRVAVVDETGAVQVESVRNNKELRDYLKAGLMDFGDLLESNFEEVLGEKR